MKKQIYFKPSITFKQFKTESIMASEPLVSAVSYGDVPQNVKYTLGNISE